MSALPRTRSRRWSVAAGLIVCLLVGVSAGAVVSWARSTPPADPAWSVAVDPAAMTDAGDRVGVVLGNMFGDPTDDDRTLTTLAAVGSRWVRVDFDWSSIEPTPGSSDWTDIDRFVALAAGHHIRVLAMLAYTPVWARPPGSTDKHPPTDVADFARFAAEAAARYGHDTVGAWEIWNEPNSASFWEPDPDAEGYTNLLRAAAGAIRAADSQATIVTGGLAPAVAALDHSEVPPETFLGRLLKAGAGDSFDGVGSHPYSYPALPADDRTAAWNSFYRLPKLHRQLVSAGLGDRAIWITEVGAPTGTSSRAVSPERQAEIVGDAITRALGLPWVAHTFVYSFRDRADVSDDPEANFGLRRFDTSAKPAWDTFVSLLRP